MEQPLRIGLLAVQGNVREHAAMLGAEAVEMRLPEELDGEPVLLRQGRFLVASFHPELTDDTRVHELFLDLVREETNVRA